MKLEEGMLAMHEEYEAGRDPVMGRNWGLPVSGRGGMRLSQSYTGRGWIHICCRWTAYLACMNIYLLYIYYGQGTL